MQQESQRVFPREDGLDPYTENPYRHRVTTEFEWDEAKSANNLAKHGLSFDEAIEVFADPEVVVFPSIRTEDGEDRFKAIGGIAARVFIVVFTERGAVKRLISARRANRNEEKPYAGSP